MARPAKPFGEERSANLFSAASHEFLEHGYRGASLNRILTRAGIAKSSFYHYFPDKAGLFDALVREYGAGFEGLLSFDGTDTPSVTDALVTVAERIRALAAADPRSFALGRILALVDAPVTPAVEKFRTSIGTGLIRLLIRWRGSGEVSAALPLRLQLRAVGAVIDVADRWVLASGMTQESVGHALRLIEDAFRPRAGGA